jgi:putative DNA primase/helicase
MELLDKTPHFFTRTAVAIDYSADAPAPIQWHKFVNAVMAGNADLVASLQEAMGYTISGYRDLQKIIFGAGPPRSGKGTTTRVMQALCGVENCATPTMEQLNEKYGLETSSGATLSVVTDATAAGVLIHAANNLKAVSGQDLTDVRRLGVATIKSADIKTQFWIFFNSENYPNFGGSAEAICARAVAIPFAVSFAGREDPDLFSKLKPELSGILNWCLAGYVALRQRGRFLETAKGEVIKSTMLRTGDEFGACLRDHFDFVAGARVQQSVAYSIFADYFRGTGAHISEAMLTRRLLKMGVTQGRPYVGPDGKRKQVPVYIGLRVNGTTMPQVYEHDPITGEWAMDKGGMFVPLEMTVAERAAADAEAAADFGTGDGDGDGNAARTVH